MKNKKQTNQDIIQASITSLAKKRQGVLADINNGMGISKNTDEKIAILSKESKRNYNKPMVSITDIKDRDVTDSKKRRLGEVFGEMLSDKEILSNIFGSDLYTNRINDIREYNFILSLIPALKQAIRSTTDDILSPDVITNNEIKVKVLDANGVAISKGVVSQILLKYNIADMLNTAIYNGFIIGESFILVTSRTDVLANAKKNKSAYEEEMIRDTNLMEGYDVKQNEQADYLVEDMLSIGGLADNDIYIESLFGKVQDDEETISFLESYGFAKSVKNISKLDTAPNIDNTVNVDLKDKEVTGDMTVGLKNSVYNKNIKLKGAYIAKLDPERIFPIEINGEEIGYCYVDINKLNETRLNSRRNMVSSILNGDAKKEDFFKLKERLTEKLVYKLKANINRRFANNNDDLMNTIMNIVYNSSIMDSSFQIKFIPKTDVIGISPLANKSSILEDAKVPAKEYILRMLNDLFNMLFEDKDKYMIQLKVSRGTSTYRSAMNAINQFTKTVNSPASLLDLRSSFRLMTRYNKLIVPVDSATGEPVFSISSLPGAGDYDQDANDAKMDKLKNTMLSMIGRPMSILEQQDQIDYASRITTTNDTQALIIGNYQRRLKPQIDNMLTSLFKIELNDSKVTAQIILDPPKSLETKEKEERITSVVTYVNALASVIIDDQVEAAKFKYLTSKMVRLELPNEDWDAIDNILKQYDIDTDLTTMKNKVTGTTEPSEDM